MRAVIAEDSVLLREGVARVLGDAGFEVVGTCETADEMILVARKRSHPATITYIDRRLQECKTRREVNRCLKRYLARNLYRLLEHGPPLAT